MPTPVTHLPPPAITHSCDQEKPLNPRYLCADERDMIAVMIRDGASQGAIARALGRSRSTISREIARNSNLDGSYNPFSATRRAAGRRARPRLNKVYAHRQLWALVAQGLDHQYSPEQIAHRIRRDFPDRQELHVCHETIYQALYVYPRGGLKKQVTAALRTGRAVRRPQGSTQRQPHIAGMVNIIERPEDIDNRLLPGDWEGDLICGEFNRSAIGTLVDRKTRYVMLLHLPGAHDAVSVRDAMIDRLSQVPEQIALSVTWDQGSEMAMHQDISAAVDIDVFFCDPHSPWQRGTNENTNGLLRQYFPKHTDLSVYTAQDLWEVEQLMNNRPRKALDWATPAEAMWEELDGILGDA
ncbi:IS30 family transposase [Corynebacteriaceae bacterium 7-707]